MGFSKIQRKDQVFRRSGYFLLISDICCVFFKVVIGKIEIVIDNLLNNDGLIISMKINVSQYQIKWKIVFVEKGDVFII